MTDANADSSVLDDTDVQDTDPGGVDAFAGDGVGPRRRRAWRPEADDEVAAVLRRLAATPWLVSDRDDEAIAAVRRNEDAVRSAIARLGWVAVIERDLARLRK